MFYNKYFRCDIFQSDRLQVSFHLPLHRYFAVFMCRAAKQQGVTLHELLPSTEMLHLLMMHPLRVQVSECLKKIFLDTIFFFTHFLIKQNFYKKQEFFV